MTRELWYTLLGIAGLAVVLGLWLLGRDIRRATRTGPKWKRTLVAAALTMLAVVGIGGSMAGCATCYQPLPPPPTREKFLEKAEALNRQTILLERQIAQNTVSSEVLMQTAGNMSRLLDDVELLMEDSRATNEDREKARVEIKRGRELLEQAYARLLEAPE